MSYPAENVFFSPVMITQWASRRGIVLARPSRIAWSSAPRLPGLEIVSRATPGTGSSSNSRPPPPAAVSCASIEDNECVAL